MSFLSFHHGTFWFQIRVPSTLVGRYGRLVRQNLSTSDRGLAQQLGYTLAGQWLSRFGVEKNAPSETALPDAFHAPEIVAAPLAVVAPAFDGSPLILRLYGTAKVVHKGDPEWNGLFSLFKPLPGAGQIFDVTIHLVQTSCGMGVPYFSYAGDRELLSDWAIKKGDEGLKRYWEEKNQMSIDGIPTQIVAKSG